MRERPRALVVSDSSTSGSSSFVAPHDVDQAAAYERLTAGEPDLADPEQADADPDEADHLVVGEDLVAGQPVEALGRHAVGAAQVAPVGQGHAQVGGHPAVPVCERMCRHTRQSRWRSPRRAHSRPPDSLAACVRWGSCSAGGGSCSRSWWRCWRRPRGCSASGSSTAWRTARRATPSSSATRTRRPAPVADVLAPDRAVDERGRVAGRRGHRHVRRGRHRRGPLPHPRRRLRHRRGRAAGDPRRPVPARRPRLDGRPTTAAPTPATSTSPLPRPARSP